MAREFQSRCGDFGQRTAISVLLHFTLLLYYVVELERTNLEESHDADDAEELEDVVLLLEVGEYEVEVERDGGDQVDDVDRLAHERQLVRADDEPNDELEREPAVADALDEEECLVRLGLALVEHPRVPRQPGRRRPAVRRGAGRRRRRQRSVYNAEVGRVLRHGQVTDDRQSKVWVRLEAED